MREDYIERFIKKNYVFGERFKKIINDETDLRQKLMLIKFLAAFYTRNVCGKYSDYYIENILNTIGVSLVAADVPRDKNNILHVATEVYETGGHTRVIYNWIKSDLEHRHSLIITNKKNIIPLWLQAAVQESGGKVIIITENEVIRQAQELLDVAATFGKIVLHTHHDDIVPIIAFSANIKVPIYFYNHADNLFWLGVSIGDLFLEISESRKELSLKKRGVIHNEVLSIPVKLIADIEEKITINSSEKKKLLKNMGINENNKIIVSMAADYKFTSEPPYDFFKFSRLVVEKYPDTVFIIIGADPNSKRWKNNKLLSKGKVIAVGLKTKEEVAQILSLTDVYVDSFLYGSPTSVFEAISYKIPSVSLKTTFSILAGCLQSDTQEEMLEKIGLYLREDNNFNFEEVLENLRGNNFYDDWSENLKKIYLIPLIHKLKIFEDKDVIIEDFEKMSCSVINKKAKHFVQIYKINLPKEYLYKLTFKNFFKTLILLYSVHPLNSSIFLMNVLFGFMRMKVLKNQIEKTRGWFIRLLTT